MRRSGKSGTHRCSSVFKDQLARASVDAGARVSSSHHANGNVASMVNMRVRLTQFCDMPPASDRPAPTPSVDIVNELLPARGAV